ncbi:uncharacterized protein LOC110989414 [Acanthaster planci]|uniref:Uncharacterized protein LOC110989414 n=1 Tax=Acanthaster planci TaxID=133434 RepID=A0A8B7ZWL2_ACAPL|nr:uncharacterized protein LOC110989414 [Acanthaster planci]
MDIYQRDERICPDEFITCGNKLEVTVCITSYALCDGKFDCPDYWDESQCNYMDICSYQQHQSLNSEERRDFEVSASPFGKSCLFFVATPPQSRVEIKTTGRPADGTTLMFGTVSENDTVDLSATFLTLTSSKWNVPSSYSPTAGVSLWIVVSMAPVPFTIPSIMSFTLRTFIETDCGPDEFACYGSEVCLPPNQRCDGIPQCPSLSDERGCNGCEDSVFTCDGNRCLDESLLCDGLAQCQDMMDEYLCGHCVDTPGIDLSDGERHVISYQLYSIFPEYSGHAGDCLFLITALADHRVTVLLRRIPQSHLVYPNLYLAMGEGHDISNESTTVINVDFSRSDFISYREAVTSVGSLMWIKYKFGALPNDQLQALDSEIIHLEIVQIRKTECEDTGHACASGECISRSHVCDGYIDCPDYSDEIGCSICSGDEFLCLSESRCVHETSLCDTVSDCADGSDEEVCGPCGRYLIDLSKQTAESEQFYNLTSPSYPLPPSRNVECSWTVIAPEGTQALATIETLQLGSAELNFGWGTDATNMDSTIGPDLKDQGLPLALVASRDRHLWLKFRSGGLSTDKGFSIRIAYTDSAMCQDGQTRCGAPDTMCVMETASSYEISYLCGLDVCGERNIYLEEDLPYTLTSPNYPQEYPDDLLCHWEFQTSSQFIIISILDFETENSYDYVMIAGPGLELGDIAHESGIKLRLTGTTSITTVLSVLPAINVTLKTDASITKKGFQMEVVAFEKLSLSECSGELDLQCENSTLCIAPNAVCNGFKDCPYGFDEQQCYTVSCPEFFQCSRSRECILWEEVCDGTAHCLLGDDEINCDLNRCPSECRCYYKGDALYVSCQSGWTRDTLDNMAATTDVLELTRGSVSILEPGHFKRFFKLQALYLTNNQIQNIPPLSFDGLEKLLWLNISQNNFTTLQKDAFKELEMLQGLVISNVPVTNIEESAFSGLKELRTLVLIRGSYLDEQDLPIDIHPQAVQDLTKLHTLYLDDYHICCEFNKLESFDPANCFTTEQQSPLFNCGSLMQNTFLRVSMWFLGLSALVGNLGVVVWRCSTSVKTNIGQGTKYVHNFLILNLAVSDFLMGVYMVIIASADVTFGEWYYTIASNWRPSVACKIAGIISVLSSEASVFFITLISVDRFLCIVFPHGGIRLAKPTARVAAVIIWFGAFILSSLPTILVGSDVKSDVYGLSDVCIGLPLITKPASYKLEEGDVGNPLGSQSFRIPVAQDHRPAWVYSIVLFLGVNLLCFLIVALCYLVIFIKVRQSYQRVKGIRIRGSNLHQSNREEMNMALRMAVIVGTDFCCWMPVIIMGLLSQTGAVTIQPHMYAWTVVFILPINSSINPYLYTLFSVISARHSTKSSQSSVNTTRLSELSSRPKDDMRTCACANPCPESNTRL